MAAPIKHQLEDTSWPALMGAKTAAAYYDEPSIEAFRRKVRFGIYPNATHVDGCRQKWRKIDLDDWIDTSQGLRKLRTPNQVADLI